MTTLRTSGLGAMLFLSLTAGAMASPVGQAAGPKSGTPATVSSPVVKIGDAWLQERSTLPDGTVRTETYLNGPPVQMSEKTAALPACQRKTIKA